MTSTSELIVSTVRDRIRSGKITPGTKLSQLELAEELGTSRLPVREAFNTLAAEGLIELKPGQSARVSQLHSRDLEDLYDMRLALEPVLATEIVDSLAPADIRSLESLAHGMRDVIDDPEEWSRLNFEFHSVMYRKIDRPHWMRFVEQLMNLVEPYSRQYIAELRGVERAMDEHDAMIAALRSRDVDHLREAIHAHLKNAKAVLLEGRHLASDAPLPRSNK